MRPQVSKVEAIVRSPKSRTNEEVRSFLGLVGWYCWFIPDFPTIAAPLTDLLSKAGEKNSGVDWGLWEGIQHLEGQDVLQIPDFNQWFLVQVDASDKGIGVCDIYRLRYYRNCCFNDVQFDNIEYFAQTQLTPT